MGSPAQDMAQVLLLDSSLALVWARTLHVGISPDTEDDPDLCVSVRDTPGIAPESDFDYHISGVQVRVRGDRGDYVGAHLLARKIAYFLNGQVDLVVDGARYIMVLAQGDPFFVDWDGNRRPEFVLNFALHWTAA